MDKLTSNVDADRASDADVDRASENRVADAGSAGTSERIAASDFNDLYIGTDSLVLTYVAEMYMGTLARGVCMVTIMN